LGAERALEHLPLLTVQRRRRSCSCAPHPTANELLTTKRAIRRRPATETLGKRSTERPRASSCSDRKRLVCRAKRRGCLPCFTTVPLGEENGPGWTRTSDLPIMRKHTAPWSELVFPANLQGSGHGPISEYRIFLAQLDEV
jgi:hypothetical protein